MDTKTLLKELVDRAETLGATANDEDGTVRRLVGEYGLGFNAWFCVCCDLANRAAQAEGYSSEVERAFEAAREALNRKAA
jgi:hypothetical protein